MYKALGAVGEILLLLTTLSMVNFVYTNKILLLSGIMIIWLSMTVVQIHHPYWEIHIVVIPCHLTKPRQATTSLFIFILIMLALALDLD